MAGVNKVILVGNLGKDPEVRAFENNKVANFPLATSENRRNRTTGERTTITEWHNIVVWGAQAEVAEKYLRKGNQVYIEGKLRTRSWDGNDGSKKYITEVLVDNFTMLGAKPSGDTSAAGSTPTAKSQNSVNTPDDDLPF